METNDDFSQPPPDLHAAAAALAASRAQRDAIIDLIRNGRRQDGVTPLSDVAIAVRVGGGCLPSRVAEVRREMEGEGEGQP